MPPPAEHAEPSATVPAGPAAPRRFFFVSFRCCLQLCLFLANSRPRLRSGARGPRAQGRDPPQRPSLRSSDRAGGARALRVADSASDLCAASKASTTCAPRSPEPGEGGQHPGVSARRRGSRRAASQVSGGRRVPLQCCTPCSRRREIQPARQRHRALQHDALLHPLAEAAGAKPPVGPGAPVPAAGAVAGAHAHCAVRGAAPEDPGPGVRDGAARPHGGAAVGADASAAAANAQPQSPAACEGSRGQGSETPPRDSVLGAGAAGAGAVLRVRGQDRELVSPGTSGSSRHLRGFQKQV